MRKLDSRRMFYDGEKVTSASFTPLCHPTGAEASVVTPQNYGDGLARGAWGDFQWDVTSLARNVWDPERLVENLGAQRIEIKETPDGDLIGNYGLTNTDRVRVHFECPRKFGFNLAKQQVFNVGDDRPAQEFGLQWKQDGKGLWYVTSLLETLETRDEKGSPGPRSARS